MDLQKAFSPSENNARPKECFTHGRMQGVPEGILFHCWPSLPPLRARCPNFFQTKAKPTISRCPTPSEWSASANTWADRCNLLKISRKIAKFSGSVPAGGTPSPQENSQILADFVIWSTNDFVDGRQATKISPATAKQICGTMQRLWDLRKGCAALSKETVLDYVEDLKSRVRSKKYVASQVLWSTLKLQFENSPSRSTTSSLSQNFGLWDINGQMLSMQVFWKPWSPWLPVFCRQGKIGSPWSMTTPTSDSDSCFWLYFNQLPVNLCQVL